MQKLVWVYYDTDGITYGNDLDQCFECTSKDDFILYVLGLIENAKRDNKWYIELLGIDDANVEWLERNICDSVFTLDEWFEKNKQELKNV